MAWSFYLLLFMYLLTAGISAAAAYYIFQSRSGRPAQALGVTMLAVAFWSFIYALELAAPDLPAKLFWSRIGYIAIAVSPFAWLLFSLQYSGRRNWLTRRNLWLLAVIPILTIVLVWSNDLHGFYWVDVDLQTSGPFLVLNFTRGWAFWVFISYSYIMIIGGAVLIAAAYWRKLSWRSPQAMIILIGVTVPWFLNVLYVFRLTPILELDLTPLAFSLSGVLIALGLFRYRLLDIIPVAREMIFENMGDGVLILDTHNQIIDINPIALLILGKSSRDVLGRKVSEVFSAGQSIFPPNHIMSDVPVAAMPPDHPDITLGEGSEKRYFSVQVSDLRDGRGNDIGQMVLWREVTERKRAEVALRRQFDELTVLHAVATACVKAVDEDSLINEATQIVGAALFPDNFGLLLLDENLGGLCFHPSYRGLASEIKDNIISKDTGITGKVAASGISQRISDITLEPEYIPLHSHTRSELCVPIKVGARIIGVINTEDTRSGAYTEADERLLTTIAGQLASGIDRLRSSAAERRWTEKLATLSLASQEVISSLDAEHIYLATHRAVAQLMPADIFMVTLLDADRQVLIPVYFSDANGPLDAPTIPARQGMSGHVIETGQALMIADIEAQSDVETLHIGPPPRVHAVLAAPMQSGGPAFGVLSCQSYLPDTYDSYDLQALSMLANQVAIALENARLFKQERLRALQMDALNDMIGQVAAASELITLLDTILEKLCGILDVGMASIHIRKQYAIRGVPLEMAELFVDSAEHTPWDAHQPLGIIDWHSEGAHHLQPLMGFMQAYEIAASITVAIHSHSEQIGGITVFSLQPRHWKNEEIVLVEAVGRQLSVAADRLSLMESIQSRLQEMTLLSQMIALTASASDMRLALNEICALVASYFNAPQAGFALMNSDGSAAEVVAEFLSPGCPSAIGMLIPAASHPAAAYILAHKKPLAVADAQHDIRLASAHQLMRQRGVVSILLVPILANNRVVGSLGIDDFVRHEFSDADLHLMENIGSQVGQALERSRLFTSTQEYARRMAMLADLGSNLNRPLTVAEVVGSIGKGAMDLSQAGRAAVYIRQPDDTAACLWVQGISSAYIHEVTTRIREMPGGQFFWNFDPVLIPNINLLPAASPLKSLALLENYQAMALWPLVYEERVIAGVGCYYDATYTWADSEKEVMLAFARQAAVALKNAGLFEETRRRSLHVEALNAVISTAAFETRVPALLERVLDLTLDALKVHAGVIWIEGLRVARNLPEGFGAVTARASGTTGLDIVQTMAVDDWAGKLTDRSLALFARHITSAGLNASLTVPVMAERKRIGGMTLFQDTSRRWLADEIALVEAIGWQLGSAVERVSLQVKIQQQADQMQQIMDTVPEGVILLDQDRNIVLANPAARLFLDDLIGASAAACALQGNYHLSYLAGHSLEGLLGHSETRMELAPETASRRIYEAAATALPDRAGSGGWVLVLRDITQERDNQAHIQMQDRLATVGQLAAGIAHDFNNIMAAIVVYADLLMMEPGLSRPSQERLAIIQNQVQRAASLIRQILDFSRRSVMEHSRLDLLPFIKELDKLLGRVLPETIRLELTYQPGVYMVNADPTRLQQVFMNLALNARDAMPGGGALRFELDQFELEASAPPPVHDLSPGRWIRIRVIDNGTGILPEAMNHIFEPFFTTKPVGQGTGLGLAQVYGIIKQHGGSIDVSSCPGEGSAFNIYLKALDLPDDDALFVEAQIDSYSGLGESVLLVEDDAATREALAALLRSQNYHPLPASNGHEALQIMAQYQGTISMVVSDIVMPEMGGLELYKILKQRQPALKLLFVTGHPLDGEAQALLEKGEVQWMQKPFSVREFSQVVKKLLEGA